MLNINKKAMLEPILQTVEFYFYEIITIINNVLNIRMFVISYY